MVHLARGVLNGRKNVFALQILVVFENLLLRGAGARQFNNIDHSNPHSADAWTAAVLGVADCDPPQAIRTHETPLFVPVRSLGPCMPEWIENREPQGREPTATGSQPRKPPPQRERRQPRRALPTPIE